MAPEKVMDYIIIHELCHLKHMNHGKQFWDTVALYMPDYKKQKDWLKVNGMKLYVI
jgi:predicted metal-dependent hydrolase